MPLRPEEIPPTARRCLIPPVHKASSLRHIGSDIGHIGSDIGRDAGGNANRALSRTIPFGIRGEYTNTALTMFVSTRRKFLQAAAAGWVIHATGAPYAFAQAP